jgi:hypothetical protein
LPATRQSLDGQEKADEKDESGKSSRDIEPGQDDLRAWPSTDWGVDMIFYHRTTKANATRILSGGFRDQAAKYMTDLELTGVFLSDIPLDVNAGATLAHDTVLRVTLDISESDLAERELVEEGKGYREWVVPAEIINRYGVVLIVGDNDGLNTSR